MSILSELRFRKESIEFKASDVTEVQVAAYFVAIIAAFVIVVATAMDITP